MIGELPTVAKLFHQTLLDDFVMIDQGQHGQGTHAFRLCDRGMLYNQRREMVLKRSSVRSR